MKKELVVLILWFLLVLPAVAAAPACLYQDVLSGPASGGEGGNGIYLTIFGKNFGLTQGTSTVTVNGTDVAQYLVWGSNNDVTGNHDQISVQVASGTTGTGNIVVTTPGGSCSNLTFTVRSGDIWFIGSGIDNDNAGRVKSDCAKLKHGTAGNGQGGSGTYTDPWTLTNVPSVQIQGGSGNYGPAPGARTPFMYYNCLATGDTLVFLNGASYPYADDSGLYSALALDRGLGSSSSFFTFMARPGATVQLGGTGYVDFGIRDYNDTHVVVSGLSLTGSGPTGGVGGLGFGYSSSTTGPFSRLVGNVIKCPTCSGSAAALEAGVEANVTAGIEVLGNYVTDASCSVPGGVSNKQYHSMYFGGNGIEVGWNKIAGVCTYNGIQINYGADNSIGFGDISIHDNDIEDANGNGINMASIDPTQGPVNVYNNVIHHVGIQPASDNNGSHSCISFLGEAPSAGPGTVNVYNNTMYDCSSYLNTIASNDSCAIAYGFLAASTQEGLTVNLVNNIVAAPAYTSTGEENPYLCTGGGSSQATLTGSHNLFYSAATPGSTSPASSLTSLAVLTNPQFTSATTPGSWTNLEIQSNSPAIAAGIASLYPALDFAGATRPGSPAIGALENGGTSSGVQVTVSAAPNSATWEQPVTLTATVAQTGHSVPTGSINFLNESASLGQVSLDSDGTATLVLSWLPVGSYKVIADYSGDSNYPSAESGYVPLQVISSTTTSLSASPNPAAAGQQLTLTAAVQAGGSTAPAGTVTFLNGSTYLGTATLDSSGVATLSIASPAAGKYSLTAQYSGNGNFLSSTSAAVSLTVGGQPTAGGQPTVTSLFVYPHSVVTGQTLTLAAAVQGGGSTTLAGTVRFLNGSTQLGTATLNSGFAMLSIASLAAGKYSLTAQYSGNANFLSSTSAAVSLTVNGQATTTSLSASTNPTAAGQQLTLTAVVHARGSTAPAGTVTFLNGSTHLGTATLNSSGVARLSTPSLAARKYSLTAKYSGHPNFLSSTSAAVPLTVELPQEASLRLRIEPPPTRR